MLSVIWLSLMVMDPCAPTVCGTVSIPTKEVRMRSKNRLRFGLFLMAAVAYIAWALAIGWGPALVIFMLACVLGTGIFLVCTS